VVAAVVAPWIARNWFALDGHLVVSYNIGAVVRGANCPSTYYGDRIGGWDFACEHFDRLGTAPDAEPRFDRAMLHDGLRYARDHAGRVPVVVAARVLRTWSLYAPLQEVTLAENEGRHRPVQLAGIALDYALILLAVAGIAALKHRRIVLWVLLAPVVAITVTSALTHGNTRFRAPAEVSIVIAAACWLGRLRREPVPPAR
jgi:hypothetical protein